MHITLQGVNLQKKKASPLQRCFDKLLKQVEREDRRLEKFASDLDALVLAYHEAERKSDAPYLGQLTALGHRLADFAGRKSLSHWHRDELHDWLMTLTQRIHAHQPETAEALLHGYEASIQGLQDREAAKMRAAAEELFDTADARPNDEPDDFFTRPISPDDPFWQQDMFGPEAEARAKEAEKPWGFDNDEPPPDPFGAGQDATPDPLDEAWIKRLFRSAAQQLHPDRETDPKKREWKQARMTELLAARRDRDVLALLRLYAEAMGEDGLALAEEQTQKLCELLEARLAVLGEREWEILNAHPERMFVHDLLYDPIQHRRDANLAKLRHELRESRAFEAGMAAGLTNLTRLKALLASRNDARQAFDMQMVEAMMEEAMHGRW